MEVAALKSGATRGSSLYPPVVTLLQTDSVVRGKDPLVKLPRSEKGEISEKDSPLETKTTTYLL